MNDLSIEEDENYGTCGNAIESDPGHPAYQWVYDHWGGLRAYAVPLVWAECDRCAT
ncbi:hypothetical protein ACFLZM_07630 [Thermodesulfobacteriota bacterium]